MLVSSDRVPIIKTKKYKTQCLAGAYEEANAGSYDGFLLNCIFQAICLLS